jgi:2-C-methyl-D-erythritol 4-phosphate cytidylyltransferase
MAPRAVALILAAGAGERVGGGGPKGFLEIGGRPMIAVAADAAAACPEVGSLVVTTPTGLEHRAADIVASVDKPIRVVEGGASRQASVRLALAALPSLRSDDVVAIDVVAIHDAARPFAAPALFSDVISAVRGAELGVAGAIPVVPVADSLKRVVGRDVLGGEPRDDLRAAQTPQAFRLEALRDAHERAESEGREFTDDAGVVGWAGGRIVAVPGDPRNFKITTQDDLLRADALLRGSARA